MKNSSEKLIYRTKDLSVILGNKPTTMCVWGKQGILPAARRNGARFKYWLKSEIDAFLLNKPADEFLVYPTTSPTPADGGAQTKETRMFEDSIDVKVNINNNAQHYPVPDFPLDVLPFDIQTLAVSAPITSTISKNTLNYTMLSKKASALAVAAGHLLYASDAIQDGEYDIVLSETCEALDELEGCKTMMADEESAGLTILNNCIKNCKSAIANLCGDETDLNAIENALNVTGRLTLGLANATMTGNWDEFIPTLAAIIPATYVANNCMMETAKHMKAVRPDDEALRAIGTALHSNCELVERLFQNAGTTEASDDDSPECALLLGASLLHDVYARIENETWESMDEDLAELRDSVAIALAAQLDALRTFFHPDANLETPFCGVMPLDAYSWNFMKALSEEDAD